ncbi:hypothetical protein ABZS83_05120 [Streptomyces sp. NPDC005426]|uniref:hypothetical protein n=1 Tax=Streptomyces sp. NPDC005426 TaxID=3155344 RepID=UPI00339F2DD5
MDSSVSPTGWNATFKPWRVEPVVGWDDLGYALIVEPTSGKRITLHDLEGHEFCGLERDQAAIVGILPGAGWSIHWADGTSDPVVGFAVQADGVTRPLLAEMGGHATPYYPDGTESSAQLRAPRQVP